jgi:hypothetical protein
VLTSCNTLVQQTPLIDYRQISTRDVERRNGQLGSGDRAAHRARGEWGLKDDLGGRAMQPLR